MTTLVAIDQIDVANQEIREGNQTVKIMSCLASVCDAEVACATMYVDGCDLGGFQGSVIDYIAGAF